MNIVTVLEVQAWGLLKTYAKALFIPPSDKQNLDMYIGRSIVVRRVAQNLCFQSVLLATASLDPSRLKVPDQFRRDFNKKQQKFTQKDQQVLRCKTVQ